MITAQSVKELREKTGAGMMDCKKALTETNGDIKKAIVYLREKGIASAAKKSGRTAAEGSVATYISADGKTAVLAEVNCETDFVANNDKFQGFVKNVAEHVASSKSAQLAEELAEKAKELIASIGENIVVRRHEKFEMIQPGIYGEYIHMGGKIGVLVEISCDEAAAANPLLKELAKDVAMQIAAANPTYLTPQEVPADVVENEKTILIHQATNEGKPQEIAEKMVAGRLNKMYKEICLMEQPFVKDDKISIKDYVAKVAKELGTEIKINKFVRYQMGEGLEKKEENFAEEIAKQISNS